MFMIRKHFLSTICLKRLWYLSDKSATPNVFKALYSDACYFKRNFSPELEAALNNQIQAEQQAAQDYLSIAVAFLHPGVSKLGAGAFFMRMYHDELKHMKDFINYQLQRGGTPIIQGLTTPTPKAKITLHEAFKEALNMEHSVTEQLEKIVNIAEKDKDYHCFNYVVTVYLEEQFDSIHKLSQHVTKLCCIGEDPDVLHQYDLHLRDSYVNRKK